MPAIDRWHNRREKQNYVSAYLSVVCLIRVLPVHVLSIGLVREIPHVSHSFFFKSAHDVRIQCREQFAVFDQRCFTSTTISRLLPAEEEICWGEGVGRKYVVPRE